jgi:predicted nuclease of restriction endonuclease-like (RecB) superfamily
MMYDMERKENYAIAVKTIKTAILQGQYAAAKGTNRIQLATYFAIGKYISLNSRHGFWGKGAIETISEQLRRELPGLRGYSPSNMKNMRLFYEKWSVLDSKSPIAIGESSEQNSTIAIGELQSEDYQIDIYRSLSVDNVVDFPIEVFFSVPFTHHIRILEKTQTQEERYYYMHRCVMENLSVDGLVKIIKQDDFLHKSILPNNFVNTISDPATARKAVMMFKDEYFLDFINTEEIGERDFADIDEKVVEKEIIHNVKNFIMTFGRDFAFIGNQYHLEVYGHDHFPDLLFFNRELNAMVVVDLKKGEFKPSYLGQLAAYLRILDDKVRKPHENQTIGLILCKSADKEYVEYIIQDYNKPMGVATYTTENDMPEKLRNALPPVEELKKLL